jgi:hypothetical protein
MKIMIRIPTNTGVSTPLANWLLWALSEMECQGHEITMGIHDSGPWGIAEARNDIVDEFMISDFDHLWMIDSDVEPPLTLSILDMATRWSNKVISGLYPCCKGDIVFWNVFRFLHSGYSAIPLGFWDGGLKKIETAHLADAVGTGCIVIPKSALKKIGDRESFNGSFFNYEGRRAEDLNFCDALRDVEVEIMVDLGYRCTHHRVLPLAYNK